MIKFSIADTDQIGGDASEDDDIIYETKDDTEGGFIEIEQRKKIDPLRYE